MTNYYYLLFDSTGNEASPVVGVFVDKSGNAVNSLASGVQLALNDNWQGSGHRGGGFNMVTWQFLARCPRLAFYPPALGALCQYQRAGPASDGQAAADRGADGLARRHEAGVARA